MTYGKLTNYPPCPKCGHDLHGLICQANVETGRQGWGSGVVHEVCNCDQTIGVRPDA